MTEYILLSHPIMILTYLSKFSTVDVARESPYWSYVIPEDDSRPATAKFLTSKSISSLDVTKVFIL